MTRIQKERYIFISAYFKKKIDVNILNRFESEEHYNSVVGSYCVDAKLLSKAKKNMIVMHPLPRLDEISTDVWAHYIKTFS